MQGFNVIYPMGYDSFGLPAENAAIDHGANPEKWTNENIKKIQEQQKRIGLSYDWTRMIYSHDPEYYRWDQYFFLKFFEMGLAYRENSYVNWCPQCQTVLANEQVLAGKCWRCGAEVNLKFLNQWFLNIRAYADELLEGLKEVDWPEKVKIMQKNWIGRSEGTIIKFPIVGEDKTIDIFTTRADTVFGVTFMVFAPEHPWIREWVEKSEYEENFDEFYRETMKKNKFERTDIDIEKRGMFIGKYVKHPFTNEKIPIFVGNFVIYEYGAGAVMAVPAHDQRDFEFAKKYDIPIKVVIQPFDYELREERMARAYEGDGTLVNSGDFNGIENKIAIGTISDRLKEINMGKSTINYKLRDWLISRQRYWGCPIPIIYCDKCGAVPVPFEDLPIRLPKDVKFTSKGNPLETSETFINVKCPKCGEKAKRETDTMDTFVDSSWYYFRYCDPTNGELPYEKEKVNYWGNVDQYIGGIEHAILHLLYARFWTKSTRDLGLHSHNEPFQSLLTQGMINKIHPYCPNCETFALKAEMKNEKCSRCGTKYIMKSAKMSKSLGNTVNPNRIMMKYGADAARFFILFGASPESGLEWSEEGIDFAFKFLKNLYSLYFDNPPKIKKEKSIREILILYLLNYTIKEVTNALNTLSIRDAVNSLIQFQSELNKYKKNGIVKEIFNECKEKLAILLHPITPHVTEEIWESLGNEGYLSLFEWPKFDENILTTINEYRWNLLQDTISDINKIQNVIKEDKIKEIEIITPSSWKYNFYSELMKDLEKTKNQGEIMKLLMNNNKEFKKHGKFINQSLGKILKNIGKYSKFSLEPKEELDFFNQIKPIIENKYNCKVIVKKEENSKDKKAINSLPGRPTIILT
ncbi:MAG: leucine--tRNA ligase [Candidatus Lokiarchaeota archaeon]